MDVNRIEEHDLHKVSELMARIKPEWWTTESALAQLSGCLVWAAGDTPHRLMAWVACRDLAGYRTLEIDTMGSDVDGKMVIGPALKPVLEACVSWSQQQGYANVRYTRSSSGLSCDGRALGLIPVELSNLTGSAASYQWLLDSGFESAGLLPDIYGAGMHGVIMIHRLGDM